MIFVFSLSIVSYVKGVAPAPSPASNARVNDVRMAGLPACLDLEHRLVLAPLPLLLPLPLAELAELEP